MAGECRTCSAYAGDFPADEKRVTCSDCGAVLTKRPTVERAWTLADLELLAKWAPRFYGRGVAWSDAVQTSGRDSSGPEDERTSEFHRASETHRRFEAMRSGDGRSHYAVLWWAFIERGGPARGTPAFLRDLGISFATRKQRLTWEVQSRTLKDRLPRVFGQRIYDAAVKAWEG